MTGPPTPAAPRLPIAAAAAGPAVVLLLAVFVLAAEAAGWPVVWFEVPVTLPEAAALSDRAVIIRMVEAGADANAAAPVRPGLLRSDGYTMTPLEAAVASRRPETVALVVAQGARLDEETRAVLVCFARDLGLSNTEAYLLGALPPALAPASGAIACDSVRKVRY